jgi:uncharacterized protein DUF1425
MKKILLSMTALAAGVALSTGCKTSHETGALPPEHTEQYNLENYGKFVLLDPGAQKSVTTAGIQDRRLDDGRLEVVAKVRNRENRRIEVQVNCIFKDAQGFSIGDETPFQTLILTENSTEDVRFLSMNNAAQRFTVRVRQAR